MRFWFYTIRAMWRICSGRWYVWRDAPDDVVRFHAVMRRYADDTETIEMARQATLEHNLRRRRARHATR